MVDGAGHVQQDHADDEDGQCGHVESAGLCRRLHQEGKGREERQHHADEMGDGAAGIFYVEFHSDASF